MLSGLFRPFLYIADDVVEKYRGDELEPHITNRLESPSTGWSWGNNKSDDSGASGASTESHTSGQEQVHLKRRTVDVRRFASSTIVCSTISIYLCPAHNLTDAVQRRKLCQARVGV